MAGREEGGGVCEVSRGLRQTLWSYIGRHSLSLAQILQDDRVQVFFLHDPTRSRTRAVANSRNV